jgi:hypothetical protein
VLPPLAIRNIVEYNDKKLKKGDIMAKVIKTCIVVCILCAVPAFLPAQTAAALEAILETPVVSCYQAVRFVCASAPGATDGSTGADAFSQAVSRGWLKNAAADDPITLGRLSFLMMKAFNLKGGMMYAIFPGPRYAYRTMLSRSFIQSPADPAMKVSGERFLIMLGNVISAAGGEL